MMSIIPLSAHAESEVLPRWFAVYTTSRHEKAIAEHFALRKIESFLPLYRTQRLWKNGCRMDLQLPLDRKSTRLNSSHRCISYAVFCLKKKKKTTIPPTQSR